MAKSKLPRHRGGYHGSASKAVSIRSTANVNGQSQLHTLADHTINGEHWDLDEMIHLLLHAVENLQTQLKEIAP